MTNFNSRKKPGHLITPERAVVVLPIAVGLVLSFLGLSFGVIPVAIGWHKQKLAVDEMTKKISELPLIRRRLDDAIIQYNIKLEQQERLLNLLSGAGSLRTWFAAVNRIAESERVTIVEVDPKLREFYMPPSTSSSAPPSSAAVQPVTIDPLLVPNVERHAAVITFQGSFPSLLSMLRRIELLESIVTSSDLHLELVTPNSASPLGNLNTKNLSPQTRLKVKFLAYGRRIKPES